MTTFHRTLVTCRPARLALLLGLLALAGPAARAQALPFDDFQDFVDSLTAVASIPDGTVRAQRVNALWTALRDEGRVPFTEGDSVAFLWKGSTSTVAVAGDHTGWNPSGNNLTRVVQSDVWMRVHRFPEAARIDYKLVLNGSNWILDPNNPHQQYSGFGPNSELRMPAWVYPAETIRRPEVPLGAYSGDLQLASAALGYPVRYRVYTPAAYAGMSDLPTLYVTDGHEYSDDRLGSMRIVLDNLIHDGVAAPCVVVFVDPRSVANGSNQREDQYVQNPAFATFVATELVPAIDAAYRTRQDGDARVILGTSLGGVFSTYLGLLHPGVFGRLAIQSPAFWVSESPDWWTGPSLFEMMSASAAGPFTIYMSTGTIGDGDANARRMRDIMLARGLALTYREVPEGHSWGNWRALLDEMLTALVPGTGTPAEPAPAEPAGLRLESTPNPAAGGVTLRFELDAPGAILLACFDVQGRLVEEVASDTLAAGPHARRVAFERAGTYLCRLTTGHRTVSRTVTVAR